MLSSDEILEDLNDTQSKLNIALDVEDLPVSKDLSLKMTKIVTWFMQNGYVMP